MLLSRRILLAAPLLAAPPPPPFRGIYPIAQTPFHPDGSLDAPTLAKQIHFLHRLGAHGVAWPQLASEFWTLTPEERLTGATALLAAARGKSIRTVIGVQSNDLDLSVRLARHAAQNGAHALISLPPDSLPLREFFTKIAAAANLPIFLQAVGNLSVDDVLALHHAVPAVRLIKDEAGLTLPRISAFHAQAPHLGIFTGAHGKTMIDELVRGASGSMPAAGPADLYVRAFHLWEQKKEAAAAAAFAKAAVFVPEFEQYGIEGLKYLLFLRGVFPNHHVREPRNAIAGAVATKFKLDDAGKRTLRILWQGVSR